MNSWRVNPWRIFLILVAAGAVATAFRPHQSTSMVVVYLIAAIVTLGVAFSKRSR